MTATKIKLPAPMKARLAKIADHTLKHGGHNPNNPNGQFDACVMEAVAFVAGEPWSDHPECTCPIIGAFLRSWNDSLNDEDRNRLLKPMIPRLINTKATEKIESRRAWMALDWLIREFTPAWLDLAKLKTEADALRSVAEIKDAESAESCLRAVKAAREEAAAAWAAAGAAARDAAQATAWAAAQDAARTPGRAAAQDAVMGRRMGRRTGRRMGRRRPPQGPPQGPPWRGRRTGRRRGRRRGRRTGRRTGPPHGTPQGTPQGPPHGTPHGTPQGTPQGPPHGTPHGPPHGRTGRRRGRCTGRRSARTDAAGDAAGGRCTGRRTEIVTSYRRTFTGVGVEANRPNDCSVRPSPFRKDRAK